MQEAGFFVAGGGQGLGLCIHTKQGEADERRSVDPKVLLPSAGLASFLTSRHLLPASSQLCGGGNALTPA